MSKTDESSPFEGRGRDPAAVKDKYEAAWGGIEQHLRQVAGEEGQNLARVVNRGLSYEATVPNVFQDRRWRRFPPLLGNLPVSPTIGRRALRFIRADVIADTLLGYCTSDTERIVELGSGWGQNLALLWLQGAPKKAEFHAFEYTEAGRRCATLLAETEPGFGLNVHPFNYYAPDFSSLAAPRRTLVYTASSIEQITELGENAIQQIAAIPGLDRVVHLEPVGWQLEEHTVEAAISRRLAGFRKRVTRGAAILKYVNKRNYNRDLWPVLKRLESRGRIAIERVEKNILGINPFNPTTLIVWRPLAPGG